VTLVEPVLGGGISSASASLDTGYGPVTVGWTLTGSTFALALVVPPNTTAVVRLPGAAETEEVGSGSHEWVTDVAALVSTAAPAPLGMQTSLSEIIDDADAASALQALFAEIGYFIGLGWTAGGRWKSNSPLGTSLIMMPPAGVARVEALLTHLNERP
jgi:alpha-L-rhamnosidase